MKGKRPLFLLSTWITTATWTSWLDIRILTKSSGTKTTGSRLPRNVISSSANAVKSVVAGDLDGDGDIDVASVSYVDDKVAWYENDGGANPLFTEHVVTSSVLGPISMQIADVDGDGNDDLVVAAYWDGKIAWYQNDGNPTVPIFTENIVSTSATGARDVAVADLDGDGDADIISASFSENKFAWHENDGSALPNFTERVISLADGGPRAVAVADMDGDLGPGCSGCFVQRR